MYPVAPVTSTRIGTAGLMRDGFGPPGACFGMFTTMQDPTFPGRRLRADPGPSLRKRPQLSKLTCDLDSQDRDGVAPSDTPLHRPRLKFLSQENFYGRPRTGLASLLRTP